jgi:Cu/Ag efflux pump CusA
MSSLLVNQENIQQECEKRRKPPSFVSRRFCVFFLGLPLYDLESLGKAMSYPCMVSVAFSFDVSYLFSVFFSPFCMVWFFSALRLRSSTTLCRFQSLFGRRFNACIIAGTTDRLSFFSKYHVI